LRAIVRKNKKRKKKTVKKNMMKMK
jgi:hypothetical protein